MPCLVPHTRPDAQRRSTHHILPQLTRPIKYSIRRQERAACLEFGSEQQRQTAYTRGFFAAAVDAAAAPLWPEPRHHLFGISASPNPIHPAGLLFWGLAAGFCRLAAWPVLCGRAAFVGGARRSSVIDPIRHPSDQPPIVPIAQPPIFQLNQPQTDRHSATHNTQQEASARMTTAAKVRALSPSSSHQTNPWTPTHTDQPHPTPPSKPGDVERRHGRGVGPRELEHGRADVAAVLGEGHAGAHEAQVPAERAGGCAVRGDGEARGGRG